ncbi:hypothetical protein ACHAWF_009596 [Thalassiosira exigua]
MGKKSKRVRGGGGGRDGGSEGGVVLGKHDGGGGEADDNAVVSDSDASGRPTQADAADDVPRIAPSLRPVPESSPAAAEETSDTLRCEDPYGDVYEDEVMDDDGSYEDVYESSGDEDGEYMEDMAAGDDAGAAASSLSEKGRKAASAPRIDANDGSNPAARVKSYNPFLAGRPGDESLEMDETAYRMHHALTPEWPSLTLDVIPDRHLGDRRTRFPHVVTLVAGSQADRKERNKLTVLRMSDLSRIPGSRREKTEQELDDEMLGEEWRNEDEQDSGDEEEENDSEEEEEVELDPVMEHYCFPHPTGGINRVRVCPHNPDVVGVWSDAGVVSLYDVGGALDVLDRSAMGAAGAIGENNGAKGKPQPSRVHVRKMRKDPFFVYSGHSTEGYAIDWSSVTPGRLATADCNGNIHIWDATHPVKPDDIVAKYGTKHNSSPWGNSSFTVKPTYSAHGDNLDHPSVEDLQWSPTEATVLASAECGGYVRIYDIRCPERAMISNKIHSNGADVNVISWNRLVGNLLASGGDDGSFCVWDLRNFQTSDGNPPAPLARFQSHRSPITSLEWHPTDESMIIASDDHGTYVYDLSVEEDDANRSGASGEGKGSDEEGGVEGKIPPQLLFVHSGSEMTKEARWHPQIASCVAVTSLSGFCVFIPSNL